MRTSIPSLPGHRGSPKLRRRWRGYPSGADELRLCKGVVTRRSPPARHGGAEQCGCILAGQPYSPLTLADGAPAGFGAGRWMDKMRRMGPPGGSIMHGEVKIGDSVVMFSDSSDENPAESAVLMIYVENCDETYKKAIAAGAKSRGEPVDQFYGDRIAKIEDPFGIHWAISSRFENLTEEEIRNRARGKH